MDGSQSLLPAEARRRRFTAADVQAMLAAGVLRDGERLELIGGELVEMSPQGPLHADVTHVLSKWLRRNLPNDLDFASQGPLRLDDHNEPEPEFFVFGDGPSVNDVRGSDAILVIEVSVSSLSVDLGAKAALYAQHGVREYWVIDVEGRRTLVHRLNGGAYGTPSAVSFDVALSAPRGGQLVIADLLPKA